jgi:hypothetical protein
LEFFFEKIGADVDKQEIKKNRLPLSGFRPRRIVSGHHRCVPELVKP